MAIKQARGASLKRMGLVAAPPFYPLRRTLTQKADVPLRHPQCAAVRATEDLKPPFFHPATTAAQWLAVSELERLVQTIADDKKADMHGFLRAVISQVTPQKSAKCGKQANKFKFETFDTPNFPQRTDGTISGMGSN